MYRTIYITGRGENRKDLSIDDVRDFLERVRTQEESGSLWMDFEAGDIEEDQSILLDVFQFHPLAVDDALAETHIPKVDDWGSYIYVVLNPIGFEKARPGRLEIQELDVFLGKSYLVTHHDMPLEAVNRVWNSLQRDDRQNHKGVDHLLYRITDEVVASFMPVIEEMEDAIDVVESEIFSSRDSRPLARIFAIKRSLLQMRRILVPQREMLNRLARDDYEVISEQGQLYFRDVYDHLVRLHAISEGMRDLLTGTLDTYLSVLNNRMNDIMKTLATITTIFMPLSVIVGFFGMNFFVPADPLEQWVSAIVFYLTLGMMVVTPITMFFWMRRKGWL